MKSYIKGVLRWDEPLGINIVTAMFIGAFVNEAPAPRIRKFFIRLSWFHSLMCVATLCSASINILTARDFFSDCLESVHVLVCGIHLTSKYITMRYKEKEFLDLFKHIGAVWGEYRLRNDEHLSETLSTINTTTVMIFLIMGNGLCLPILHVINICTKEQVDTEDIRLPAQLWIPSNIKENSLVAAIALQMTIFYSPLLFICVTSSFLYSLSAVVEALGFALAEDIRRQKEWNSAEARKIYMKHQEIIRIVARINSLMAWNWGLEVVCASVQLTLPAYETLRALQRNEFEVFKFAFELFLHFMMIHLIFASGDRILSMGERIRSAFWETKWYESPLEDRKNILFMTFRNLQPIEYKYKIIHFDLEGFTTVVNSVFSYIAVLQFFDSKKHGEDLGL